MSTEWFYTKLHFRVNLGYCCGEILTFLVDMNRLKIEYNEINVILQHINQIIVFHTIIMSISFILFEQIIVKKIIILRTN